MRDLHASGKACGLHPARSVHGVSKQTIPRHPRSDDAGAHVAGVRSHADAARIPVGRGDERGRLEGRHPKGDRRLGGSEGCGGADGAKGDLAPQIFCHVHGLGALGGPRAKNPMAVTVSGLGPIILHRQHRVLRTALQTCGHHESISNSLYLPKPVRVCVDELVQRDEELVEEMHNLKGCVTLCHSREVNLWVDRAMEGESR